MKYLLALALVLLPVLVKANPIDSVAAHSLATRFVSSDKSHSLRSHQAALKLSHARPSSISSDAIDYYIFNFDDGSGFVIIAGDDRAKQVLAYGDGTFDIDDVPDNLHGILDQYAEQTDYLFAHPEVQPSSAISTGSSSNVVPQLLTTEWGQRTPYRDQCPQVDGSPCVTGCIATSMAQVMSYWKYPSILPSVAAYTTLTLNIPLNALPMTSVQWDQMKDSYRDGEYTQEQAAAVALLMRYCGQAVKMDYTISSSGAWMTDQLDALKRFGFDQSATLMNRSDYDDATWNQMIQVDLLAGYPVIYSGKSTAMSHNFILDGYDGSKYHVNWGWDGSYNGYYELDAMAGGSFRPTLGHQMLHGVYPVGDNVMCDFALDGVCYRIIGDNSLEVTYKDTNYNTYSGNLNIPDTVNYLGHTYRVTAIGNRAFLNSNNLISITIPKTATRIGEKAFYSSGIKSITIPDELVSIGPSAFENCKDLTRVELGTDLVSLGLSAFQNCTKLTYLVIESSSLSIGDEAFVGCPLDFIMCTSSTPPMGNANCFSSTVYQNAILKVPDDAEELYRESQPWQSFSQLVTFDAESFIYSADFIFTQTGDSTVAVDGYLGHDEEVVIPPAIAVNSVEYTVNAIDDHAFRMNSFLRSIEIPNSVISIGQSAFQDVKTLDTVKLGSSLRTINASAFKNCESLQSIVIPESVLTIGDAAFARTGLNTIVIPNSVSGMGQSAFEGCTALTSATISTALQTIPRSSFKGCKKLKSAPIPDTIQSIGDEAFYSTDLNELVLPNSVTSIGNSAFRDCKSFTSLTLGPNLRSIGTHSFRNCSKLYELYIESTSLTMGDYAFYQSGVKIIVCKSVQPPTGAKNCFHGQVYTSDDLMVPDIAELYYSKTSPWQYFNHIIPINTNSFIYVDDLIMIQTSDSTACVIKSKGTSENIVIPQTIVHNDSVFSVTAIRESAFNANTVLNSIVIPNTITAIGPSAFENCTALTSVTLSNSLKSIESSVFKGCIALKSLQLPENLQSIGDDAFSGCGIINIVIPDLVTSMGLSAFENCTSLREVTIGTSLQSIASNAFYKCANLTTVEIPDNIITIGDHAFAESGITSLVTPNSVTSIGQSAFENCKALSNVRLSASLQSVPKYAFNKCAKLATVEIPDNIMTIEEYAFAETGITSLVIPNSVNNIGQSSFENCKALSSVRLSASLQSVPKYAFNKCTNLATVEMPDHIMTIEEYAFAETGITSLVIPNSVTSIGKSAFMNCNVLKNVTLSSSLSIINANVFEGCESMKSVELPESVTTIGDDAFKNCKALTSVTLDTSLKSIGNGAFRSCESLTSIEIPNNLTAIGDNAFNTCKALTCITLGTSLISIGNGTFRYCESLTSISIPESAETIGDYAFYGSGIIDFVASNSVTSIGNNAFQCCNALKSVVLETSINSVGIRAFSDCSNLSKLTIKESRLSLGSYAFSNSPIEHVLCESTTPPTGDAGCFSTYVYQTAVLEVPVIAEELYRDSQPWKSFSHIVTNTSEDCIFIDDYILNKTSDNTVSIIRYRGNSDTLTIPQSITYDSITYTVNAIADIVFYNNNILQSIKIPNSVISIGKSCFEGCSSLKSISIPSSIEEIGTNAFYKCNELESLYIQDIGAWCEIRFDNKNSNPMSMVQHIYLNEEEITNTSLTIPPTTTLINDYAFAETGFTNFILPDEVTSIGNSAFEGCVKLKAITLPNALVSLGNSAFKYCYSLETVTMPSELKTISADAFYDCYALTEVNLNDGLVSISDDAFYNCSMTSIEFPNTLESIGSYAFYCCPLSGIRLPDGLKSLGNGAFEYCNSLTEAYLGKSLQMIPFAAFMNCFSLTHVEIPETVTDIFDAAFAWCSLSEMPMNDNIRYIGNDAFEYNPFSVFRLGKSVTTIGWGAFHSCKNITDVVIGDQVTDLGEAAFENCNNLESVVIGEGLRFIESYIFDYCDKIHHVTIGSNVRAISYGAFYGCPDITDITCKAKNPPIVYYNNYESCFSNSCFDNTTIFVPMGSVEAYKNADQWKKFKHIVGICMSDIAGDTNCDQEVNIADINALLNTILDGEYDSDMDVNGDGEIDIADINAIINLILSSGR